MHPGERIRERRMQLKLKAVQIERLSRLFAARVQDHRFSIPHATLAGIEAGSVPTLHKLLSLAYCLRMTEEDIFEWYGIDLPGIRAMLRERAAEQPEPLLYRKGTQPNFFPFPWPSDGVSERTEILFRLHAGPGDSRKQFRYARIGTHDDCMMDIVAPGSLICVDTEQQRVIAFPWATIWHRPIYLVWHPSGHSCCWCQQNGNELFLICHPASRFPVRRYRTPRDATIVGRVVSVWSAMDEQPRNLPS